MPTVPTFLSSFADRAQSAINSSGIAQHLPSHAGRPTSPDGAQQPTANESAGTGGSHTKSHAFGALQHQLRTFGQQYSSSTLPVQKIITNEKGVAIDLDSLARDAKAQSKELYTWGQAEDDDLKDVTDRLAYINFVQGSLASSLAIKLDAARAPLKSLRDAETALGPKRNVRVSIQNQLARIEHEGQKGNEKKLADLKEQLTNAEAEDAPQERELELLKRKAVRESEQLKWDAIREYGEKLVLLSQASTPILAALPLFPPTPESPYTGVQATGAARASLQRALDNYKTGHINLPQSNEGSDLGRSDTRSFGESHAHELSRINTDAPESVGKPGIPMTPPIGPVKPSVSTHAAVASSPPAGSASPPINTSDLNLSPATIPEANSSSPAAATASQPSSTAPAPIISPNPQQPVTEKLPPVTPTVAETGVPVAVSKSGPGPATGSIHDLKGGSGGFGAQSTPQGSGGQKFESAEEEKRRLAGYSPAVGGTSQPAPASTQHESAEDEKKRLEREERERVLRQETHNSEDSGKKDGGEEDLPPYQDI